jgi:hypothetical protein
MRFNAIYTVCLGAWLLAGCASGPRDIDPAKEKLIDKLTLFIEAVQTDKFEQAFTYLTPSEKAKMAAPGGDVNPMVRRQLKAVRLSTLAQKPTVRLVMGKLEGICEQLPMMDNAGEAPAKRGPDVPLLQ